MLCAVLQEDVYEQTTKNFIRDVLRGYNVTVFAYGPTGTHTHTVIDIGRTHLAAYLLTHSLILTHSLTHTPTHLSTHTPTHLSHSPTHSPIHSHTHSPILVSTHPTISCKTYVPEIFVLHEGWLPKDCQLGELKN